MSSKNPEFRLICFAFKKRTKTRIKRLPMSLIIYPALLHSEGVVEGIRMDACIRVRSNWTGRVPESSLSDLG